MNPDAGDPEPDVAELFAPLSAADRFGALLSEAQAVLSQVHTPVDAELWGSDMIGALSSSAADTVRVMDSLAAELVPAAERAATREALALLRIFGAIGLSPLRETASAAAGRLAASGVPDAGWAEEIGSPRIAECWHYGDVGGRQESVTMSFGYGESGHALSVLIDHGKGGQIKDAWVGDAAGLLAKTRTVARTDALVVFETIDAADARGRLERAISAGECPQSRDQADDVAAHRALLYARVALAGEQAG